MSFKTPLLCDRRVYDKKGSWKNPNDDIDETIFYFVKEPRTMAAEYNSYGNEELKETTTIVVFGGKPISKNDLITLETGEQLRVVGWTINYFEPNILVKDLLKPRIESIELTLE